MAEHFETPKRPDNFFRNMTDEEIITYYRENLGALTITDLNDLESVLYKEIKRRGLEEYIRKAPKKTDAEVIAEIKKKYGEGVTRGKLDKNDREMLRKRGIIDQLPLKPIATKESLKARYDKEFPGKTLAEVQRKDPAFARQLERYGVMTYTNPRGKTTPATP